jgi:hypothetical protein
LLIIVKIVSKKLHLIKPPLTSPLVANDSRPALDSDRRVVWFCWEYSWKSPVDLKNKGLESTPKPLI